MVLLKKKCMLKTLPGFEDHTLSDHVFKLKKAL